MGPGQKFLTRVRSGQFFVGRVGSGRVGSSQPFMVWVWIWKISPKNVKFFNFLPFGSKKSLRVGSESTRVKGRSASYLLLVKSKLGSGQVRAHLYFYEMFQIELKDKVSVQFKSLIKLLQLPKNFIASCYLNFWHVLKIIFEKQTKCPFKNS